MSSSRLRICEISHFFCYAAYRQKAAAMARLTGERELLLTPADWTEDFHDTGSERDNSNEYILRARRTLLNWKAWGPKRFQLFLLSPRIVSDLREYQPDIIVVDSEPFGLLAFELALIRRLFFARTALVVHSSQSLYKNYPFPFSRTEAFVLAEATTLFARTEAVRQVLLRKGCRQPVHVIPHGVDTQRFSPVPQGPRDDTAHQGPLRIGYVGAVARHKGVDTLLEAADGLRTPFTLSIAGDGPARQHLEAKARTSPAASRIRFRGSVPNAELPNFLRTLDVLVVPSITMPNWNEQFGRIIIEAMACAVPVIGSTCGSIPEIVGEGGVVFPEKDAGNLRTTLERLATDRSALQGLSQRARQRVMEHFSWEIVARRILKIYHELLGLAT